MRFEKLGYHAALGEFREFGEDVVNEAIRTVAFNQPKGGCQ